jgi:capsular exopolysaccharide synthesis family protein
MFGMGGFALAALLSYLFDASARIFRSSEQIEAALGVPIITHVPLDDTPSKPRKQRGKDPISQLDPKLAVVHRPLSSVSEAISCIRTAIFFHSGKTGNKVYQVTSPLPGDGKSTLAANIASSLAMAGKKVLLIDLDLRSPRLTGRFNLDDKDGVTNLLNGDCDPLMAIHRTPIANLDMLPSGKIPANPAEALSLPEMREAFDWFRDRYDFVIVDTPPLLLVTDPAIVTSYVDATLLVMRIVRSCKPNSKEAMSILRQAEANVMGVLVNKVDEVSVGSYYQVGGYGSYGSIGYGYGRKYREERKKSGSGNAYVVKGRVNRELVESAVSAEEEAATTGPMNGQAHS